MKKRQESRDHERNFHKIPVTLYSMDNPEDYYSGLICNRGQGGMYVETDADLKGNHYYIVRIPNDDNHTKNSKEYTEHNVIIRWAQLVSSKDNSDPQYQYGYGMECVDTA